MKQCEREKDFPNFLSFLCGSKSGVLSVIAAARDLSPAREEKCAHAPEDWAALPRSGRLVDGQRRAAGRRRSCRRALLQNIMCRASEGLERRRALPAAGLRAVPEGVAATAAHGLRAPVGWRAEGLVLGRSVDVAQTQWASSRASGSPQGRADAESCRSPPLFSVEGPAPAAVCHRYGHFGRRSAGRFLYRHRGLSASGPRGTTRTAAAKRARPRCRLRSRTPRITGGLRRVKRAARRQRAMPSTPTRSRDGQEQWQGRGPSGWYAGRCRISFPFLA